MKTTAIFVISVLENCRINFESIEFLFITVAYV